MWLFLSQIPGSGTGGDTLCPFQTHPAQHPADARLVGRRFEFQVSLLFWHNTAFTGMPAVMHFYPEPGCGRVIGSLAMASQKRMHFHNWLSPVSYSGPPCWGLPSCPPFIIGLVLVLAGCAPSSLLPGEQPACNWKVPQMPGRVMSSGPSPFWVHAIGGPLVGWFGERLVLVRGSLWVV